MTQKNVYTIGKIHTHRITSVCMVPASIGKTRTSITLGKKAGTPGLPTKFIKLLLPSNKKVVNIECIGDPLDVKKIKTDLMDKPILPYQNPVPIGHTLNKELTFDNTDTNEEAPF